MKATRRGTYNAVLLRLREEAGLSQAAAGALIGIHVTSFNAIERKNLTPFQRWSVREAPRWTETAQKISDLFGVDQEDIFVDELAALPAAPPLPPRDEMDLDVALDQKRMISRILASGTEREGNILRWHYGIGCRRASLEEIGERLSITRERVRQIESAALRRLREQRPWLREKRGTHSVRISAPRKSRVSPPFDPMREKVVIEGDVVARVPYTAPIPVKRKRGRPRLSPAVRRERLKARRVEKAMRARVRSQARADVREQVRAEARFVREMRKIEVEFAERVLEREEADARFAREMEKVAVEIADRVRARTRVDRQREKVLAEVEVEREARREAIKVVRSLNGFAARARKRSRVADPREAQKRRKMLTKGRRRIAAQKDRNEQLPLELQEAGNPSKEWPL